MNQKRIIIAGGSGFLGESMRKFFVARDFEVKILSRSPNSGDFLQWDAETVGPWAEALEGAYALINMTGRTVDCRYTEKNKAEILRSRIDSTAVLGEAVKACTVPPQFWLNSSTATIYQHTVGDAPANTESTGKIADDFSMGVAKAWEAEFFSHITPGTAKTALRTSIVMGVEGGAFPVMAKLAAKGLCSPQGSGKQWISWMHIDDFCAGVMFVMENGMEGPVNFAAPEPVQNFAFNRMLREEPKPRIVWPQPVWVLTIGAWFMKTQTELILKSRKVVPERLLEAGFEFRYTKAGPMVKDLFADALKAESKR